MRALRIVCSLGLAAALGSCCAACRSSAEAPRSGDAAAEGRSDAAQPLPRDAGPHADAHSAPLDAGDAAANVDAAVSGQLDAQAAADASPARDAAESDAAGSDASPPARACAGVFCEDFESGQLASAVWTRQEISTGNRIDVQSTRAAHGKYALQFHAQGGTARSMLFFEHLPEALQQHFFGRMYYFATGFPTESGGHTAYITASNGLTGFPDRDHHLEVASYFEDPQATWQMTYWQGNGPEYIGSGGEIPKGQWFCLEWEFNDAPDEIGIWVNGDASKQGASFRNINNHASGLLGALSTLGVGFRTWHAMGAPDIDIYMDDIVLDTTRVGCLQ